MSPWNYVSSAAQGAWTAVLLPLQFFLAGHWAEVTPTEKAVRPAPVLVELVLTCLNDVRRSLALPHIPFPCDVGLKVVVDLVPGLHF